MRSVKEFFLGKSKKVKPKKPPVKANVQTISQAAATIRKNKKRAADILKQLD